MKVINRTDRRITPLVTFCAKRSKLSVMAVLRVEKSSRSIKTATAMSWKSHENGEDPFITPSLVQIDLAPSSSYPKVTQRLPSLPRVELRSFEEEFVLTLAHELRHIDQFWRPELFFSMEQEEQAECDAELHAIQVLEAWRKKQRAAA